VHFLKFDKEAFGKSGFSKGAAIRKSLGITDLINISPNPGIIFDREP